MPDTSVDGRGPVGHTVLLTTPSAQCRSRIESWVHAARARGERIVTVAVPDEFAVHTATAGAGVRELDLAELRAAARSAELVHRALDEGHRGLGVLICADGVIAASSRDVHATIESALGRLCRSLPVSVLCLYDRQFAGTDHLDMVVEHHPDEVREAQGHLRQTEDTLQLAGEFDVANLDVLVTALNTRASGERPLMRIDVSQVPFLAVAATRALAICTADYRDYGGRVELRGAAPQLRRVLRLLGQDDLRGFDLVDG